MIIYNNEVINCLVSTVTREMILLRPPLQNRILILTEKNSYFDRICRFLTEILTDYGRSEKRSSKFYCDRSVKNFWPTFWPTDSRSKLGFDRLFGQKNAAIIPREGMWREKLWPKSVKKFRSKWFLDRLRSECAVACVKFWPISITISVAIYQFWSTLVTIRSKICIWTAFHKISATKENIQLLSTILKNKFAVHWNICFFDCGNKIQIGFIQT